LEFMQGPGTSPFPPTGIYYRLAHKCLVPRFFAYGSEWSVGQIKGRPLNVQAKGGLWPTRAFYAECAQVRAGRNSRNADFISIAQRAIRNPRPERPSNLRTFRPSGRSILRTLTPKVCPRAIPQPSARRAVKLKNPWAEGPSILRTFLFTTLRHNPPPSGGHNPRGEAPSTFPSEPFHWKMLISSQNYLISINQGGFHHEVHIFRTCML
jgi:hypothetical protein